MISALPHGTLGKKTNETRRMLVVLGSAAASLHLTSQGVAHIGRHLTIGVTHSSIDILTCYVMSSCLHTGALLDLLDLVRIHESTKEPLLNRRAS